MPRQARIDAPGALHHIIGRGIDRQRIFQDNTDRDNFLDRLGKILLETQTACFAWALIPNHFHLLLRTGTTAIFFRTVINLYYVRKMHIFWNWFDIFILIHYERPMWKIWELWAITSIVVIAAYWVQSSMIGKMSIMFSNFLHPKSPRLFVDTRSLLRREWGREDDRTLSVVVWCAAPVAGQH